MHDRGWKANKAILYVLELIRKILVKSGSHLEALNKMSYIYQTVDNSLQCRFISALGNVRLIVKFISSFNHEYTFVLIKLHLSY